MSMICLLHSKIAQVTQKMVFEKLRQTLHLQGGQRSKFEYLARDIEITDTEIRVVQPRSAQSIGLIPVTQDRKKKIDDPATSGEKSELRSLLGTLQWLCQHTRVYITVSVNKVAQRVNKATVRDLLTCNAIAKTVLETQGFGLTLRKGVFDMHNYVVVSFGDAAFANDESVKSQYGEITLLCRPDRVDQVMNGRYDLAALISWKSATVKRVVRSTLSSEGYAISEAGEQTVWITQCLEELQTPPGTDLKVIEEKASKRRNIVFTDSGPLTETV